ncbi:DUF1822 family protein [Alkalinema sp. FACHB-956]|uniref:DUF1822 family protein n=1 Tax=Alkalinema sp. FACHB-956 TaxID=2692768 RepID=UPI001685944A|nr:DUF1822 family protein [Alkalinema sp. FACHB-956]MBD2326652.1 DUF1822 family protein [Alkalinema sp. FACHB-956]
MFSTTTPLPLPQPEQVWRQTDRFRISPDRWTAYLNQLAIAAIQPWLQAEFAQVKPALNSVAQASLWSCTTGTPLLINGQRWVIIPTETIDQDEWSIPQEWIDIPDWAADYYVAVDINPDGGAEIWGFASHYQIKTLGIYEANDRSYRLSANHLITDLATLHLRQEFCPQPLRAAIAEIPKPTIAHAQNLIARLATLAPTITLRLELPFSTWAGLIAHGGWRQDLHQQRQGLQQQPSIGQWLRQGLDQLSSELGWQQVDLQFATVGARGHGEDPSETVAFARQLTIAGQSYELQITPLDDFLRFELRNTNSGGLIPGGFRLTLLTEDLEMFEGNQALAESAIEALTLEVALEHGEGIVWEVEPTPDAFEREIVRL